VNAVRFCSITPPTPEPTLKDAMYGTNISGPPTLPQDVEEADVPEWVRAYQDQLAMQVIEDEAAKKTFKNLEPIDYKKPVDAQGRSYGTGRRKASVARVWIKPGTGEFVINKTGAAEYLDQRQSWLDHMAEPFECTETDGEFDVWCTSMGGGHTGQAGAIRLGIARALQAYDPKHRPVLKAAGLLMRDSRVVERKKPGQKKARKKFQWVKR
jgi:small subunit ribosomal protein S9